VELLVDFLSDHWGVIVSDVVVLLPIIASVLVSSWKVVEGQRCILRAEMLSIYYKCKDEKKIRQYEAEHFEKCYVAYKALRGNSFIDEIYSKSHEWEVVS
jgi:hypothetical protein